MSRTSSRRGSALLIVLGMLSFMIISAVGFAAYMRYSRQPSSFLRRSASTRQLTKAALSLAIDQIDRAIGNNPHPGVGTTRIGNNEAENAWINRVFIGTNCIPNEVMRDATVSPLCLEALAYIPAPLVNDVRYWSRLTKTASWHPLGFDAGRYSWCAVDISDYLDVNRLVADAPRSSAAARRVTLAHLFEGASHRSSPSSAKQWDTFMEAFRGKINEDTLAFDLKSQEPLISVADFNLALGAKGKVGDLRSPFCDFVTKGGGNGFYNFSGEQEKEAIRQMTFVTDSLIPPVSEKSTNGAGLQIYDLSDAKNQPFEPSFLETTKPALSDCVFGKRMSSDSHMKWVDHLSGLGCAALYDYLDPDHVPISLAIPTTERVPMFCGVQPNFTGAGWGVRKEYKYGGETPKRSGDQDDQQAADPGATRQAKQTVYYRVDNQAFLKGFMTGDVRALACFPFNHEDPTDGTFTADGRFSLFLTSGDVSLRTGSKEDPFGLKAEIEDTPLNAQTGLISVKLNNQNVSFAGVSISEQKDALRVVSNPLTAASMKVGTALSAEGNELLRIDYIWTQTYQQNIPGGVYASGGTWEPGWDKAVETGAVTIESAHCGLPATVWTNRRYTGIDQTMLNDASLKAYLEKGEFKDLTLRAAVWLRMKDKDGKVVDLVPATIADDAVQNQVNDPYPLMQAIANDSLGRANPLLLFNTGVSFSFSPAGLDALVGQPQPIELSPKTAIVADPRYNHAPEHWYKMEADLTAENWLSNNQIGSSTSGRDNDIFMATSDAGYLQSRYEMAFLPRFSNLVKGGDTMGRYESPEGAGILTEIPDSFDKTRNKNLVWETFDPLNDNADAFYDLPWHNLGRGLAVNPYSDSTNVIMAALANTPIDWKRASTNVVDGVDDFAAMTAAEFNKKYAFNEYSEHKLAWTDLQKIAGAFIGQVHAGSGKDWTDAWDDLAWAMEKDEAERIMGFELDSKSDVLWTADRKFLYGFWRDCFAAKQQLFLVFVRTEPMMMGSEGGQTRPQLGARAMAVVWRDPTPSKPRGDGRPSPHQTRVLFYRQFE